MREFPRVHNFLAGVSGWKDVSEDEKFGNAWCGVQQTRAREVSRENVCAREEIFFRPSRRASHTKFLTRLEIWIVCFYFWYANRRRCSRRCRTALPLNFKLAHSMSRSLRRGAFLPEVQRPAAVHLEKKQQAYVLLTSTSMQIYVVCITRCATDLICCFMTRRGLILSSEVSRVKLMRFIQSFINKNFSSLLSFK